MPELPEVENVKTGLAPELEGSVITDTDVWHAKSMPATARRIGAHVRNARIEQLWRRGKVMGVDLSSGYSLLIHLKMTGQLVLEAPADEQQAAGSRQQAKRERLGGGHPTKSMAAKLPDSSTRVIFTFEDDSKLYFNDQRKFGWIKLLKTTDTRMDPLLSLLGPEPLSTDFTYEYFYDRITRRKLSIKATLLDQSTVAGLGNIYVDESLHLACIHPARHGASFSTEEVQRLYEAIRTIIGRGIEYGGTTMRNFVNHNGERGNYFDHARVFNRTGQPCPECGATIEKVRVANRGTHICPECQKPE